MNNVNIIGNITKEPELRHTSNNKPVCGICVAVSAGRDAAYFIDCVAWGDKAENIAKYFHKGDKIGITGMITTRMYEHEGQNRKATEVTILSFDFCNGKKTEAVATSESEPTPEPEKPQPSGELPFEI